MDLNQINIAKLAYIGDAVYELEVRNYLLNTKKLKVNELKKESLNYVSAVSQSCILDSLIEKNLINNEELNLIKRARNYKTNSKPRYTKIKLYKKATALEALIGFLYLNNDNNRIKEIMKEIFGD